MDIYSLDRFLEAQERDYPIALQEIKNGKKRSHWMWYIFPQLRGLGRSARAHAYGIEDIAEARAYLEHPILEDRLREITKEFLKHKDKTAYEIFGDIDAMKLRSSMTLFVAASSEESVFYKVLECFFDGEFDRETIKFLV